MKIGVSSCLLGTPCRYDGLGAKDKFVVNILSEYCEFVPVCPEAAILPTPRDTIRLVKLSTKSEEYKAIIPAQNNKDITDEMNDISQKIVDKLKSENICGFVLKSKSPSCGLERVKVYQKEDSHFHEKNGKGLFAKKLKENFPYLPIEEESRLLDPWLKENFLLQVFAYNDLIKFMKNVKNHNDLIEFHTSYKYLIYAKSQEFYKEMGKIVANHEQLELKTILSKYETEFVKAISIKNSINKTYNVLINIVKYFKKLISKEEQEELLQTCLEYKNEIIPLIAVIKQVNLYVKRFDVTYLRQQKFLNPYPVNLSLRSDIKAYK
jgi:uncharacterized protein YbbK (DUF523 family)/uncharacterized protein YbgA (DUF1722 family)